MNDDHQLDVPLVTVGQQLKAAREKKGWTTDKVAKQLRLSMRQIEDIETDEYGDISLLTYTRGYIRSYATLLELPVEPLISEFNRVTLTAPSSAKKTIKVQFSIDHGVRHRQLKTIWRVIGGLVSLFFVIFISYQYFHPKSGSEVLSPGEISGALQTLGGYTAGEAH